jgi:hypothetical protein
MDYMLRRIGVFTLVLDDSRICLNNNAAERVLRGIALGSRSQLRRAILIRRELTSAQWRRIEQLVPGKDGDRAFARRPEHEDQRGCGRARQSRSLDSNCRPSARHPPGRGPDHRRYEKTALSFAAMLFLVRAIIWLR